MNSNKSLPAYRVIETTINRDTIVSQVSAFLYAAGVVLDNEEVLDIEFGGIENSLVDIKIHIKKPQKVEIIKLGNKNE